MKTEYKEKVENRILIGEGLKLQNIRRRLKT